MYLIFKRFEPVLVRQHFWLLAVPPALVAACVLSPHYAPARAALLAFGVHCATILGATLLYRAGPWHPLARYPGPYVYRLSKIALAWRTSDGKQFEHLKRLHDRYGDIVRVGEWHLHACAKPPRPPHELDSAVGLYPLLSASVSGRTGERERDRVDMAAACEPERSLI